MVEAEPGADGGATPAAAETAADVQLRRLQPELDQRCQSRLDGQASKRSAEMGGSRLVRYSRLRLQLHRHFLRRELLLVRFLQHRRVDGARCRSNRLEAVHR